MNVKLSDKQFLLLKELLKQQLYFCSEAGDKEGVDFALDALSALIKMEGKKPVMLR